MAAYSPRRSSGPILRSPSPTGSCNRQYSASTPPLRSTSSSFASATSSAFGATRSLRRPACPASVNPGTYTSPSLSFSFDRTDSTNRSISMVSTVEKPPAFTAAPKRTCMCSPTNHPGSFRCSLHKSGTRNNSSSSKHRTASCGSSRLNMMRSAMKNSLVRIGTVEGDLVKRALASLIRPSSHQQRRRGEFRPRPSRLSIMSEC